MASRSVGSEIRQRKGAAAWGLFATLAVMLLTSALGDAWEGLEERVQAALLLSRGDQPWHPDVVLLDFDEETEAALGHPPPRAALAAVVDALTEAGAKAIAIDAIYDRPSSYGPADDAALAASFARSGRVLLAIACHERGDGSALRATGPLVLEEGPAPAGRCGSTAFPREQFLGRVTLTHVQYPDSPAGYERDSWPLVSIGPPGPQRQRFPSLSVGAYAVGQGLAGPQLVQRARSLQVGPVEVPLQADGRVRVSYRGQSPRATWGVDQVVKALEPGTHQLKPEAAAAFEGKYVLIGTSLDLSGDINAFATGRKLPNVLHHVAFLSDLLEGQLTHALPGWAQLLAMLACGLLMTVAALGLAPARGALAVAVLWLVALALAKVGLSARVVAAPLGPMVAGLAGWVAALTAGFAERERERRVLRDAFGAYVDGTVLERILSDPQRLLSLAGARRDVTVMFTDIVGFTPLTNRLGAEEIVALLREYLAAMTRLVTAQGGRVDKIMGDGILAVFGDPVARADHARCAVTVAGQMLEAVEALSARWEAQGRPPIAIRIGISSGEVFVGDIGSRESKLEYTVLGAVVNIASRLEGRAPPGTALVSQATRAATEADFEFEAMGALALKGFATPQEASLLLGPRRAGAGPRRHPRVRVGRAPVELRHGAQRAAGFVTNASEGGLFVETALEVPVGAQVEVRFPGGPETVLMMTVRRARLGEGLGLEQSGPGARLLSTALGFE